VKLQSAEKRVDGAIKNCSKKTATHDQPVSDIQAKRKTCTMGIGMMGIAVIVLAILAVGTIFVLVISRVFGGRGNSSTIQAARGVTLACPHCGEQTEAAKPQCQHCSKEL
jgi:hypothetical protein